MKHTLSQLRPATLALIAINIGLLGVMLWLLGSGTQTGVLLKTAPRTVATPTIDLPTRKESSDFALLQDKALFYASRRFFVPPDPSSVPVIPPAPDCRLAGIFIVPKKPPIALLTYNSTGVSLRVKAGDDLDGWHVHSVERGRVVLNYEDTKIEIASASPLQTGGLQRVRIAAPSARAANGVRVLGSGGTAAAGLSAQTSSDARLYRPPPTR